MTVSNERLMAELATNAAILADIRTTLEQTFSSLNGLEARVTKLEQRRACEGHQGVCPTPSQLREAENR